MKNSNNYSDKNNLALKSNLIHTFFFVFSLLIFSSENNDINTGKKLKKDRK